MAMQFYITIILAVCMTTTCAFGKPISSVVGGRQMFSGGRDDSDVAAADYVQDGLVSLWDGYENAGWGVHSDDTSSWIDLVEGYVLNVDANGQVGPDAFYNLSSQKLAFTIASDTSLSEFLIQSTEFTIEFCEDATSDAGYFIWSSPLLQYAARSNGYEGVFLQQYYDRIVANGSVGEWIVRPFFSKNTLTIVVDKENGFGRIYMNGMYKMAITLGSFDGLTSINTKFGITNKMYCIRVYGRVLTAEEVAKNYEIDMERYLQ